MSGSDKHIEVAKVLLDAGAEVNASNNLGSTALMSAARSGELAVAKLLLDAGADVNAKASTTHGDTPLSCALKFGYSHDLEQLLLASGARLSDDDIEVFASLYTADLGSMDQAYLLCKAARYGQGADVRTLLSAGAHVDGRDAVGGTPLITASRNGRFEVAHTLLAAGAGVKVCGHRGETALMCASERGHLKLAKMLLGAGAAVNASTSGPEGSTTALIDAAWSGHLQMVKLLLDAGADVNASNMQGDSALLHASKRGFINMEKLLLASGATANFASQPKHGRYWRAYDFRLAYGKAWPRTKGTASQPGPGYNSQNSEI